jgi:polyisoprenyl-phosphate glycosyltransferase
MSQKKRVTIICPVHNEEEAIPLFYRRLQMVLANHREKYSFELLFSNNGSTDNTLKEIQKLSQTDPSVQYLTYSRNFGYQWSLIGALTHAKGDANIIIDVDCEDPPELIEKFLSGWAEGYDLVYGLRTSRPEPILLRAVRKIFYRLTRSIADSDFILDMAEFSLFTKRMKEVVLANKSTFPFVRAELGFAGFKRKGIPFVREPRICGKTHYNLWRMSQFAVGGILSSSTFLLRLAIYLGAPLFVLNLLTAVITPFFPIPQWEKFIGFINSSFSILFITVICTYLARIYKNGVQRPLYIVDWENTKLNAL